MDPSQLLTDHLRFPISHMDEVEIEQILFLTERPAIKAAGIRVPQKYSSRGDKEHITASFAMSLLSLVYRAVNENIITPDYKFSNNKHCNFMVEKVETTPLTNIPYGDVRNLTSRIMVKTNKPGQSEPNMNLNQGEQQLLNALQNIPEVLDTGSIFFVTVSGVRFQFSEYYATENQKALFSTDNQYGVVPLLKPTILDGLDLIKLQKEAGTRAPDGTSLWDPEKKNMFFEWNTTETTPLNRVIIKILQYMRDHGTRV